MFNYTCLNPIAGVGLDLFSDDYKKVDDIKDADAALVRSAAMHDMELGDKVLAVARAGAGVNNIPLDKCAEQGIVVFNTPGANANGVKELVLAGMLLASRDIAGGIEWVKSDKEDGDIAKTAEKQKKKFAGCEISGKKLGIIGLGAIGRRVAQIARAFGANVIYYSASGRPAQDGYTQVDFNTLLTTSDIISVHAPLNEHTENILDKCAFAKMKETCIFLNLGRGPIVVEQDLYDALVNGEIAAAGLDVLSAEPMSEKNPLIKIQDSRRLFITPHIAWASVEARTRLMQIILDQVKEYFHM